MISKRTGWEKRRAGKRALKKLTAFARHGPDNVLNKFYLLEAERLALKGHHVQAVFKFQISIAESRRHEMIHEQALAFELAGVALLEWGEEIRALEYFEEARSLYQQWGSPVKVDQLTSFVQQMC